MTKTILHINSIRWNSAITEYLVSTHKCLEDQKQIVIAPDSCAQAKRLRSEGIEFVPTSGSLFFQILAMIRKHRPDFVITYNGPETSNLTIIKKITNIPFRFYRFRGQAVFNPSWIKSKMVSLSYKSIDALICPSKYIVNNCEKNGIKNKKELIYLGCNQEKYYFDPTAYTQNKRLVLTILGRFSKVKGHFEALKAFALLVQNWPQTRPKPFLQIVGMPTDFDRNELESAATKLDLKQDEDFKIIDSQIENVQELMQNTTVGWISSVGSEFIARVAYEFLLCGTPVAVSQAGSLPETLVFQDAGAVCDIHHPQQAASVLAKLLIHSESENLNKKNARAMAAIEHFGISDMKKRIRALILQK